MAGPHGHDYLNLAAPVVPTPIGDYLLAYLHKKDPKRKTDIWSVYSQGGSHVGHIRWYPQWRCYVFEAITNTIFNSKCLHALGLQCDTFTRRRRQARKTEKMYEDSEKRQ